MKFLMVMIICFAEDTCQAVFDTSQFNTYDECMLQAVSVTNYMRDLYPSSAGEIHCLDEKDYAEYKAFIDNGGKPALSLSPPENIKNSI